MSDFKAIVERAKQAMADESVVMNREGRKGRVIQIDEDNREYTFLLRYGKHSLGWIPFNQLFFSEEGEL